MNKLTVRAEVKCLDEVRGFIRQILKPFVCTEETLYEIEVAAEEIFVNIANYAYAPGSGDAVIRGEIAGSPPELIVSFSDSGKPYNPLAKPDPDLTLPAEERPIGGLGIYMVKQNMDHVSYRRHSGQNILTIRKRLNG